MIMTEEVATNQAVESAPVSESSSIHYCELCGGAMIAAPALQDAEDGTMLPLRCFVRRNSSGCYVAECIDLDICAEAETLETAIVGLQDAMKGYLLVVFDGAATDGDGAISVLRPSPLSHRIRYHIEYLKYRVFELIFRTHGRTSRKFYSRLISSHCGI
jgi:hypothetical protein